MRGLEGFKINLFYSPMKTQILCLIFSLITLTVEAKEISAVPHPDEDFPFDQTVVWTPLFQAAWDHLHSDRGTPVRIDPPNALMDRLDHFSWDVQKVMPDDFWKVWAGEATQELLDQANWEAAQITGQDGKMFQIELIPDASITLGLLHRNLLFERALYRANQVPLEFHSSDNSKSPVYFFGTRGRESGNFRREVQVLHYQGVTHAIQISGDSDDAVVIFLPERPMSFSEACTKIRGWRENRITGRHGSVHDPFLHKMDDVRIPLLNLNLTSDFLPLLSGHRYFRGEQEPWFIYKAEQHLSFELTEKGARTQVKVEIGMEPFGEAPKPPPMVPRTFHYNRPFFVFLWREEADWPYLSAWVGNTAPMKKFSKK